MSVLATTEAALLSTLYTAIEGITPTSTVKAKWQRERRPFGESGLKTRSFFLRLGERDNGPEGEAGYTTAGQSVEAILSVWTAYCVSALEVDAVVFEDALDLDQAINNLKKNGANGLWWVEFFENDDGPEPGEDVSQDQWICEHRFLIRYQKARSY